MHMKNTIDNKLLKLVVCPSDKGSLVVDKDASQLVCTICKKRYNITESGIPIFLKKKEKIANV